MTGYMIPNQGEHTMFSEEPVALGGTIQGALAALIALALGFGWVDWSQDQVALILGAYTALVAVVTTVQRSKVTPV